MTRTGVYDEGSHHEAPMHLLRNRWIWAVLLLVVAVGGLYAARETGTTETTTVARVRKGAFAVGSGRMDTSLLVFDGRKGQEWNREALALSPQTYVWSAAPVRLAGGGIGIATTGMSFEAGIKLRRVDIYRKEKGASEWTARPLWAEEKKNRGPVRVAAGDVDGNGMDDLVVTGADGQVWLYFQDKSGPTI